MSNRKSAASAYHRYMPGPLRRGAPLCVAVSVRTRAFVVAAWLYGGAALAQSTPTFARIYPLAAGEGVFAYARISPDGNYLAYASEAAKSPLAASRLVKVVDLKNGIVKFSAPGIDAYWAPDGKRMIYSSFAAGDTNVSLFHLPTGLVTPVMVPADLGDYYSWGTRNGKDLILTIIGRYYYLNADRGVLPAVGVQPCPGIGGADRPLLSKDGRRISTFVDGTVVIRNLTNCDDVIDTHVRGAKADFSWDGRYVAMHVLDRKGGRYDIQVVDIEKRTVRTITTGLNGSSFFPSWTRDNRVCFRYDGSDYRGFVIASNVMSATERPLPVASEHEPAARRWSDIFPETPLPAAAWSLVLVWGTWGAHSQDALVDLQRAGTNLRQQGFDIQEAMATDPGSHEVDIESIMRRNKIAVRRVVLAPQRVWLTEETNQNPTTLLFRNGALVSLRMGAQSVGQLFEWVKGLAPTTRHY
jgi:hypothetical protein